MTPKIERMIYMPVYKDEKTGTFFVKFYYTDFTGEKKQKKKRGFKLQREAKAYETEFIAKQQADMTMPFSSFIELYYEDMSHRLRQSTMQNKRFLIDLKLLPYFGKHRMCDIKATHVRKWQNDLISYRDASDKPYSQTYIRTLNNQITAIFNYAIKYYGLADNPCRKAGTIGKNHADEMEFWTFQEFSTFIEAIKDKPQTYTAFMTLYYTGIRIGELMALTLDDIDFENGSISVSKTRQRLDGADVITPPKTPKSKRIIPIPPLLVECIQCYVNKLYGLTSDDYIFPFTKWYLHHEMNRGCKLSGVKRIRLHDLRHSHASLLIELGFSPLLIADRLGHEKVETTLNTYSHLYPHKQDEVVEKLQALK